ncbi:pyridoxal-phosphate dependent enzyme [Candidatus Pelagibacter sp.]|nr:pyridoxal-phosphate dependent enzyme [Candidatus Pelagibacter sp.]
MSKIYFQGTYGAYSHLASLEIDSKAEIIPCKTFDECFLKATNEKNSKIVIPESNRITGNIGIEYLIFKYRLNIYSEHFQKIEHNLLGQKGAKLADIKNVFSHAQAISQCSNFIKKNNLNEHVRADTAGSAEMISKNKKKNEAAIASSLSAGYAGKMLSMAAKKFGLKCKIFMGAKDIKRQKPNCDAMRKNGAEIVPVYSGSQTLVDAVSECMRYWVSNCDNTHMCVGSTVGPNIFVKICGWSTAQISRELKVQLKKEFKKIPKKIKLINCVGGGSSAYGFWSEFIDYDKKQIELVGVEAGGPKNSKLHAAPLSRNAKIGILHGAASYVCQNNEGQIQETESISAGLDYPGVSPIHCFLKDTKRARYTYATDEDALDAHQMVTKFENLNPSLEPSHAFAEAIKIAPKLSKDTIIIVNSCGDAKKDRDILKERLGKKR